VWRGHPDIVDFYPYSRTVSTTRRFVAYHGSGFDCSCSEEEAVAVVAAVVARVAVVAVVAAVVVAVVGFDVSEAPRPVVDALARGPRGRESHHECGKCSHG
jgi:hypothetical protein